MTRAVRSPFNTVTARSAARAPACRLCGSSPPPDNSFLPGGAAPQRTTDVRGVAGVVSRAGHTIEIPTGGVVVGIYALTAHLADAAAATIVPINDVGAPGAQLPARLPDTGFGQNAPTLSDGIAAAGVAVKAFRAAGLAPVRR